MASWLLSTVQTAQPLHSKDTSWNGVPKIGCKARFQPNQRTGILYQMSRIPIYYLHTRYLIME
jgi:hypothetical protein